MSVRPFSRTVSNYIPRRHCCEKVVDDVHIQTHHGCVGLTMSKICEKYWIPKLRHLAKQTMRKCYVCKRSRARAFANPPAGNFSKDRIEGRTTFQVIGVDFVGLIYDKQAAKREGKS